MVTCTGYLC